MVGPRHGSMLLKDCLSDIILSFRILSASVFNQSWRQDNSSEFLLLKYELTQEAVMEV